MYINAISLYEAAKMKQLQEQGGAVRYRGQIGRSQTHYTVEDFPLMRRVFAEDLWPILKEIVCFLCTTVVLFFASLFVAVPLASMSHAHVRANALARKCCASGVSTWQQHPTCSSRWRRRRLPQPPVARSLDLTG